VLETAAFTDYDYSFDFDPFASTNAPPEADSGRPNFANFGNEVSVNVPAPAIRTGGSRYCPVCDVAAGDESSIYSTCFAQANYQECDYDQYCGVEVRQRKGIVRQLKVRCMRLPNCQSMNRQNFFSSTSSSRGLTACRPEVSLQRGRFGESICRGCVTPCESNTSPADCIGALSGSDRLLNTGLTFIEALKQNVVDQGLNARSYWDNGAFIEAD